jgi:putative PIN family toxin of toxin-antitoxin system
MIRAVVDANIFVSAVLKPASNPGRMLKLVRAGKIKLLASADILSEVEAVLLYPKLMKLHQRSPMRTL